MKTKGQSSTRSHLLFASDVEVMSAGEEPIGADQKGSSSYLLVFKLHLKHPYASVRVFIEGCLCSIVCQRSC